MTDIPMNERFLGMGPGCLCVGVFCHGVMVLLWTGSVLRVYHHRLALGKERPARLGGSLEEIRVNMGVVRQNMWRRRWLHIGLHLACTGRHAR